jgi:hypothetical protein
LEARDFSSWEEVQFEDLLAAFRKAKADCFFERSVYVAEEFAAYENDLIENLKALLSRLKAGEIQTILSESQGTPGIFAKGLTLRSRSKTSATHAFFSDADRAFERLTADNEIVPEFRIVGDFAVNMHVISGLWINCIGHKFDGTLSGHAFGSRVRRYGGNHSIGRPTGAYQYDAVGTFDPYFQPYRRWRDAGVDAIRSALEADDPVVALTLDFSSYYHSIDPRFMVDERFLSVIELSLTEWEIEFTRSLIEALTEWSSTAAARLGVKDLALEELGGLPIGLSAVRIITNVLLYEMDKAIVDALHPVYYGRYVDDVFLVIKDSGRIQSADELWHHLQTSVPMFNVEEAGEVEVRLPGGYQANTRLRLKREKQRVFFLQGQAGKDLLSNIAHQVRTLSSERRLMPLVDDMDASASARALAAAASSADEPDSLRRADGLTLRRLGWALQLRSAEILARDLERGAWSDQRRRFYDFACGHILRPDKLLEQIDYLPRLISLAVSLADWADAKRMYNQALSALEKLEAVVGDGACRVNGEEILASPGVWSNLRKWVGNACREAILRSIPWDSRKGDPRPIPRAADRLFALVGISEDREQVFRLALDLRESDLAKRTYKHHLRLDAKRERPRIEGEFNPIEWLSDWPDGRRLIDLQTFLASTRGEDPATGIRRVHARCDSNEEVNSYSLLPYVLATRPYTAQEVALYKPDECVFGDRERAFERWGAYTRALRGAWHGPMHDGFPPQPPVPPFDSFRIADLGANRPSQPVRLGITSLETSQQTWSAGAVGRPDLSIERYDRLATIVNLAINAKPRPTHLLLPELSVPDRWLGTIADRLLEAGISLIAGLDYEHYGPNEISSSVELVLRDGRLGFPSSVEIRQPKLQPAPAEEEDLYRGFGKTWKNWALERLPIYIHDGLHFGVLVCSELQNIRHREAFQGNVDLLVVLSWNKDLETFSSLVESASLDVHSYVALVNNRAFGDSRVRAPRKEARERDICRIRGGENEHLVVVKIDPAQLRAQQSRSRRWPRLDDRYKPAPEGFEISDGRRSTPN